MSYYHFLCICLKIQVPTLCANNFCFHSFRIGEMHIPQDIVTMNLHTIISKSHCHDMNLPKILCIKSGHLLANLVGRVLHSQINMDIVLQSKYLNEGKILENCAKSHLAQHIFHILLIPYFPLTPNLLISIKFISFFIKI